MCQIIEAKVHLTGGFHESFVKPMPRMGRSSYSKKRKAKIMGVYYKCANGHVISAVRVKEWFLVNREDKIWFIKDGLSKESLDDIIQTLKTYHNGDVYIILLDLVKLFKKEKECYSLKNLTLKDHVC